MYLLLGGMQAILNTTEGINTPSEQCIYSFSSMLFRALCHIYKEKQEASNMLVKFCFTKTLSIKNEEKYTYSDTYITDTLSTYIPSLLNHILLNNFFLRRIKYLQMLFRKTSKSFLKFISS